MLFVLLAEPFDVIEKRFRDKERDTMILPWETKMKRTNSVVAMAMFRFLNFFSNGGFFLLLPM
jgi:hypothetical protein